MKNERKFVLLLVALRLPCCYISFGIDCIDCLGSRQLPIRIVRDVGNATVRAISGLRFLGGHLATAASTSNNVSAADIGVCNWLASECFDCDKTVRVAQDIAFY